MYKTIQYNWSDSMDSMIQITTQLIDKGIGLSLGMDRDTHLERAIQFLQYNQSMFAVYKDDELQCACTILAWLVPDVHWPGLSTQTGIMASLTCSPVPVRKLILDLREAARERGADWLVITSNVSPTEYKTKGWRL